MFNDITSLEFALTSIELLEVKTKILSDSTTNTTVQAVFPEFYWDKTNPANNLLAILCLLAGSLMTFLYVSANKYYSIWIQDEDIPKSEGGGKKKKFKGVSYIFHSRWKSFVLRYCSYYGLFAVILFVLWTVLDMTILGMPSLPLMNRINTGSLIVDFLLAGLLFAAYCHPFLTANIISLFSFSWLQDMFAKINDKKILDDIENSKFDYIKTLIAKNKKESGYDLSLEIFEYKLFKWQKLAGNSELEDDDLVLALEDAKNFDPDLLVIIRYLMNEIGDETIRSVILYRVPVAHS